jgi:hypothetical protein
MERLSNQMAVKLVRGMRVGFSCLILFFFIHFRAWSQATPPICPAWAFEHWAWEDNGNTQSDIEGLVDGYLSRDIPVGAVIIDSPWESHYNDFIWDTDRYPDPQGMIDDFQEKDIHVIVWMTGFVNQDSPDFQYVKDNGYAVDNGKLFTWWKGEGVHIDFTNPDATEWFGSKLDAVHEYGIRGWKVDQGADYLDDQVLTSVGAMSKATFKDHFYSFMYDYTIGKSNDNLTLARAYSFQGGDGAPIEVNPISWLGDYPGDFEGINRQKNDLYLSADRGYSAPGIEVGGFQGAVPTKNSLIRYAQFGALTPLMLNGGSNGGLEEHLPWFWNEEVVEIYRYYAVLHHELVPFFFSKSVKSHLNGGSILKNVDATSAHHQLGDELFVSVLTSDVTTKNITFPNSGRWIDYWDEAKLYDAETQINYKCPLENYPLFIRSGSAIPLFVESEVTGHGTIDQSNKVTLLIYPDDVTSATHYLPIGSGTSYATVQIEIDEKSGVIQIDSDTSFDFHLRVKSFDDPITVENTESWSYDSASEFVKIDKTGKQFTINFGKITGYRNHQVITIDPTVLTTNFVVHDSGNASDWSVQTDLKSGDLQYGDRPYTFVSLPDTLAGCTWIRTANDSKLSSLNVVASFEAVKDLTVFVAHKDDILTKPSWLSNYEETSLSVRNSEDRYNQLTIFTKHFSKGELVELGKNGSDNEQGMYSVFLIPDPDPILSNNDKYHSEGLRVYPNPAMSLITIDLANKYSSVGIYSVGGQVIAEYKVKNQSSCSITIADLAPGLYLIKAKGANSIQSRAFVKQ